MAWIPERIIEFLFVEGVKFLWELRKPDRIENALKKALLDVAKQFKEQYPDECKKLRSKRIIDGLVLTLKSSEIDKEAFRRILIIEGIPSELRDRLFAAVEDNFLKAIGREGIKHEKVFRELVLKRAEKNKMQLSEVERAMNLGFGEALKELGEIKETVLEIREWTRRQKVEDPNRPDFDQEMNIHTLQTYLKWKFPDREMDSSYGYSELLQHLKNTGHTTFERLDGLIDIVRPFAETEEERRCEIIKNRFGQERKNRLIDVGFLLVCLEIGDPNFWQYWAARGEPGWLERPYGKKFAKRMQKYHAQIEKMQNRSRQR